MEEFHTIRINSKCLIVENVFIELKDRIGNLKETEEGEKSSLADSAIVEINWNLEVI